MNKVKLVIYTVAAYALMALFMPSIAEAAEINGVVWYDMDINGVREEEEEVLSGSTLEVFKASDDSLVASYTVGDDGAYSIEFAVPAQAGYYVKITPPAATTLEVSPGKVSDWSSVNNDFNTDYKTNVYSISDITVLNNIDAGLYYTGYSCDDSAYTFTGTVFYDTNANGIKDSGEQVVVGATYGITDNDYYYETEYWEMDSKTDSSGNFTTKAPNADYFWFVMSGYEHSIKDIYALDYKFRIKKSSDSSYSELERDKYSGLGISPQYDVYGFTSVFDLDGCESADIQVAVQDNGYINLYRFWSDKKQGHFYTASNAEAVNVDVNDASWRYEGIGYGVISLDKCDAMNADTIYRFWSDSKQGHFYTISPVERDSVINNDASWRYEGEAYCAYEAEQSGTSPVYRFWSDSKQHHFYTISQAERDFVINNDPSWRYEGIAYYAKQ